MKLSLAAAFAFLFLLPACLETEEDVTVRPDGSCSVKLTVKGQAQDFAEGYPVPCGLEWKLVSADEPNYLLWLRTQMSSEDMRARLPKEKDAKLSFELAAEYPSLDLLPRYNAPVTDPYRTAYLSRTSTLRTETRGGRKLYTFERRYGAREYARFDTWSRMKKVLPSELVKKLDDMKGEGLALTPAERDSVVREATEAMRDAALAHLDDALLAEFTYGRASFSPAQAAGIREAARLALDTELAGPRLREVIDVLCSGPEARAHAEEDAARKLDELESSVRACLRRSASQGTRELQDHTAILAQLESSLTAIDQTNDLADERFTLRLHLPGTLVGGNYDKLEDGAAVWEFQGDELQDREIVLRAVSIVE